MTKIGDFFILFANGGTPAIHQNRVTAIFSRATVNPTEVLLKRDGSRQKAAANGAVSGYPPLKSHIMRPLIKSQQEYLLPLQFFLFLSLHISC